MSNKNVPVFTINVQGGGTQKPISIPMNAPVHSSYTGNLVGYGQQSFGTPCDAPKGHANYGKKFHVIVNNPTNKSWMMHRG